MATIQTIRDGIAFQVRDTGLAEFTATQALQAINDAARDAGSRGWLIPLSDNTSLTYVTGTYEYSVPASFAFIRDLLDDGVEIARHYWELRTISSTPKIVFHVAADTRIATASVITVVGYKRPNDAYTLVGDTVDVGIESFLRDRAAAYVLQFMSAGTSELDLLRERQRELKYRDSEIMLQQRQKVEDRLVPRLRLVPGR